MCVDTMVCSSACRAGWLVIGRSLVHIPAELHVLALSKILNPKLLLMCGGTLHLAGDLSREYPALAQRHLGLALAQTPTTP